MFQIIYTPYIRNQKMEKFVLELNNTGKLKVSQRYTFIEGQYYKKDNIIRNFRDDHSHELNEINSFKDHLDKQSVVFMKH